MSDRELQIKIALARTGLSQDAAAAARTIQQAMGGIEVPIGVDREKLAAEAKAVEAFLAGKFDEIPVGFKVDADGKLRNSLGQFVQVTQREIEQKLGGLDIELDLSLDDKSIRLAEAAIDELANETLQAARQAKFLKEAYDLKDDEIDKVIRKMGQLERSTESAKREGGALGEVFTGFLRRVGEGAFNALIGAVQRLGQAVAGMVADSVRGFVEFEGLIKQAGVISGSLGTEDFEALGDEVERLGIVTSKTPQEIAATSVALSRAGFSARETAGALDGIARASEATGETLENTGDIVAKTYRAFQGQFEDAGMEIGESSQFIANALVQTANSTNTTVTGLGESFNYLAAQAAASNQPIDDMLVLIGLLGDAGIQGSSAGTGLATALDRLKIASAGGQTEFSNLVRGSARMSQAFDAIGTEVRNADGSMKSLLGILPIVQQNIAGFSQQDQDVLMKSLFGVEGGRAFQTLLNVTPERLALVSGQVKELAQAGEGAAVRGGEAMLTGLSGALDLIGGSLASLQNQFAESLSPALEEVVRAATDIINTLLETDGLFDPLLEAAQRFAAVLSGNAEVTGDLTDQIVNFATVAVEQLAAVLDAITAFIGTEGNIKQLSKGFEDLVTVLGALATVVRVVIALADGMTQLRESASDLPIIGSQLERFLQFGTPLLLLANSFQELGKVMVGLKDLVISAVDSILERVGRLLPVLQPLIDRVQGLLSRLASAPEVAIDAPENILPAAQEPQDNRDPNRPRVPTRATAPAAAVAEAASTAAASQAEFTALEDIAKKYQELTTTLETEQADQIRALVEGGKSREEIAAKEREQLQARIKLNEQKLGELKAINQDALSAEDAAKVAAEILSIEQGLANDRLKLAQEARDAAEDLSEAQIKAAEEAAKAAEKAHEERLKQVEAEQKAQEALIGIELDVAEQRLASIDRVSEALERQLSIVQAQASLAQAVFDLESSLNDAKRDQLQEILDDEKASQSEKRKAAQDLIRLTEEQFAREKEQLEAQQELERQAFDLEQQRAAIEDQRAIKEQELALKRLELQRLEIQNEIELARLRGDTNAIAIGEAQLGLLAEQTAVQQEYLASLQQQAALSGQLAAGQRSALLAQQEQQDVAQGQGQRQTARGVNEQVSGLGRDFDRRGNRLESGLDRTLQRELQQAQRAIPRLAAGINPEAVALANQPTTGLSAQLGANLSQPIVAELQALSGSINALAASPRQLTVQTPDPVADTSRILSDISRQQTAGVNP